jgi:hypothetical protein
MKEKNTVTVSLGPSEELPVKSSLNDADWNFVKIYRHYDPLVRWWGNTNSKLMNKLILSYDVKPRKWKVKLFHLAQNQYDKYGDYYRILDNSMGEAKNDDIYECF